jgi:peptidoglycan hydrolase-like protein with peptidoglycan-binding domain
LLRVGSTGNSVRLIQEAINKIAEVTPGIWKIAADGIFGNGTRAAVMAFQRMSGLTADGIVGQNTWSSLMDGAYESGGGSVTPPPSTLPPYPGFLISLGSSGSHVKTIQQAVNRVSLRVPSIPRLSEDGVFGPNTRNSVIAFQRHFGLTPDGITGQLTWGRLMQEAAR